MLHYLYMLNEKLWLIPALQRDNFKCVKCGQGNAKTVIVHHIDNSRKNGLNKMNNNLSNLMTVCRPCHAVEHGYSLRWSKYNIDLIVELYFNLGSFTAVGKYLGISRQRVHQLVKIARVDLAEYMDAYL